MSSFRILELRTENRIYKMNETTGFFQVVSNNGTVVNEQEKTGLLDILLDVKANIGRVKHTSFSDELSLGSLVLLPGVSGKSTINNFKVKQNRLFVNDTIDITTISTWIEPKHVVVANPIGSKLNNFTELQATIEKSSKSLKLGTADNLFKNVEQSLESFLTNFLRVYNKKYITTYINGHVQCNSGKRRSLGDIYMICKNYYPECTLHEVIGLLYVVLPAQMKDLGVIRCETIEKKVWYIYGSSRFDSKEIDDEWGNNYKYYTSKLKEAPLVVKEVTPVNEDDILSVITAKFPVGTKFKSMITSSNTYKVDSNNLYNGLRSIVLIQRDGSRKIVYDKTTKTVATIIK
jgi:hypothetical protein